MNRAETAKILSILASVWSSEVIDDAKLTAYQWALEDVPYSAVEAAAGELLRSAKFFPKPSEIRELVMADQPALDSKLYQQYSKLRRIFQTGHLSDQQSRELARIERKLGIPTVTDRPVSLRAVSG